MYNRLRVVKRAVNSLRDGQTCCLSFVLTYRLPLPLPPTVCWHDVGSASHFRSCVSSVTWFNAYHLERTLTITLPLPLPTKSSPGRQEVQIIGRRLARVPKSVTARPGTYLLELLGMEDRTYNGGPTPYMSLNWGLRTGDRKSVV